MISPDQQQQQQKDGSHQKNHSTVDFGAKPPNTTTGNRPSKSSSRQQSTKHNTNNNHNHHSGEKSTSSSYSTQSSTRNNSTTEERSVTRSNNNSNVVAFPVTPDRSDNHHHANSSSSSPCAIALEYSAQACECLEHEHLEQALQWYQRALMVYQTALSSSSSEATASPEEVELSVVDTCNAAATLHNMGAVYTALQQADEALQCYSDAESLYRECRDRLPSHGNSNSKQQQQKVPQEEEEDNDAETICLTALIAETLHHRSKIYESSVWDSVAALECHEACVELLSSDTTATNNVVCVDDVYFQPLCPPDERLWWLTQSYCALSKLYKHSDTPQDGLEVLQAWHALLETHLANPNTVAEDNATNDTNQWRKSLADCCRQLSDYYFGQDDMARGIDSLYQAMDLTLQIQQQQNVSTSMNSSHSSSSTSTSSTEGGNTKEKSSLHTTVAALSHELLQQMNALASTQEHRGDYDQALVCYEKVLLLVSRYLGENHIEVAETLVNIGRVMELQGNAAGGLDLYHAAHTIYQAAIKDGAEGTNGSVFFGEQGVDSSTSTTTDNNDDYDRAMSMRAATESVVRIANVLMGQKRWEEAVDFLRELPQAKEWLSWLDDASSTADASQRKSPTASPPRDSTPSVDQAIVFRELGRAYMGMGSLAKAKQCLLESARRLEGTDHEEDVFELLMHVEFCQKQEKQAAEATSRNRHISNARSRSRSRARARNSSNPPVTSNNRSGHSRTNSTGSSSHEERARITKDVVAAVLSPPPKPESPTSSTSSTMVTPPRVPRVTNIERDGGEAASNDGSTGPTVAAQVTDEAHVPSTPASASAPPANKQWVEENRSSDSRSLGSLASSNVQTPVKGFAKSALLHGPISPSDSFQVQRAMDIILKRSSTGSSPIQDYDDNKSDVVSSILVGLDIDIDLPPPSPTPPPGRPASLYSMMTTPKSVSEKPFDEASMSQASSRGERPFDESSRQGNSYPMLPGYRPQTSLSDLTPTVGQSSSSSVTDFSGPLKPVSLPSLLQKDSEYDADHSVLPPPPPSSAVPSQIATAQNMTKDTGKVSNAAPGDNSTIASSPAYPVQQRRTPGQPSVDDGFRHGAEPKRVNMATYEEPFEGDDDDASSDPFEGYEDFDADDISEGERSPSYSGDSESEQGYTRFAKEDFTSDEEDSVASGYSYGRDAKYPLGLAPSHSSSYQHDTGGRNKQLLIARNEHYPEDNAFEDDRQPHHHVHDAQTEMFAAGTRESPNSSGIAPEDVPVASRALPKRDTSPTLKVNEEAVAPKKEIRSPSPSPQKKKRHTPSPSPSHRIVKALSNSIRRRGKKKQDRGFDALPSNDSNENSASKSKVPDEPDPIKEEEDAFDEDLIDAPGRPFQFLSMPSPSFDDAVSQITFLQDDYNGRGSNKGNQWWGQLGINTEKLDGWFPNTYLHQAVEAAEGFLSAKAIHAQVKSQPLDFDDEEDDDVLIRSNSALPEGTAADAGVPTLAVSQSADVALTCGEIQLFKVNSQGHGATATPGILMAADQPLAAPDLPMKSALMNEAVLALEVLSSTPSPNSKKERADARGSLEKEVERHEKLVEQLEVEGADDDKTNRNLAATLFRLAILCIQSDKIDDAMDATNEALRVQKMLGDTADAARSLHLLADIFVRKGEYESALSCYSEVQEMELELYGYIHEDTANTLNRIGGVLARQSKFSMAMEKHQEALRILKEYHGEELRHPLVSQTLIHIGAVYYRERNSLATARSGSDGYTTFIEVGMLEVIGRAHEDRGSYKMAISFFEEKLQFLNQKNKDPSTVEGRANLENVATTLNSLGMLSCRAGIFMEAIDYYDRALEVQKEIGCDKMHIATARVLTATVQFHMGYFRKALRLLQDALEELQIETGADHETVAATWFQIGVVQVALCEYDDGMDALEEALRIQNKLLGKIHPATLRTRREIGKMYAIYESELDAAFLLFNDILATQRRIHGYKHPNVAETLHSLGCAYSRKGDFANAIKTLEECYYMRMDFVGADHPLQATTLHEIAEIHRKRNRHRKAIHICNSVLDIRKESLSEHHLDVARALATKADSLVAIGKFDQAQAALMEALPMTEAAVGPKHPAVADVFIHLAGMHLRKCHFDEAKEWIEKAMEIYETSNLDEDHPSLKEATALMERVDRDEMLCV